MQQTTEASRKAAKSDLDASLRFGARHRTLSWDLQKLCVSFLSLDDLHSLLFVSHALSANTMRFLRECRSLSTQQCRQQTHSVANLALRLCNNLTDLDLSFSVFPFPDSDDFRWPTPAGERWIVALLRNNQKMLRRINLRRHVASDSVFDELAQCPALESIVTTSGPPASAISLFTPQVWPKLHTLVQADTYGHEMRASIASTIFLSGTTADRFALDPLNTGLPLIRLALRIKFDRPNDALANVRSSTLTQLSLYVSGNVDEKLLVALGDALSQLHALTHLEIMLAHHEAKDDKNTYSDGVASKCRAQWLLPQLRAFSFSGFFFRRMLRVLAPNLETVKFFGGAGIEFRHGQLETMLKAPNLTSIDLWLSDIDKATCSRFCKALREGCWPNLTALDLQTNELFETRDLLGDLCKQPLPLRHVFFYTKPETANSIKLRRFLLNNPRLHTAAILVWNGSSTLSWPYPHPSHAPRLTLDVADDALFDGAKYPQFHELRLREEHAQLTGLALVLSAFPSLRSLYIQGADIKDWSLSEPTPLTALLFEDIPDRENVTADVISIIKFCPHLELLQLPDEVDIEPFAALLAKNVLRFPCLSRLKVFVSDKEAASLVLTSPTLEALRNAFPLLTDSLQRNLVLSNAPRKNGRAACWLMAENQRNEDEQEDDDD